MEENREIRDETTVDGVRAIEMRYRPVFETGSKKPAFFQSTMRLNAPDMGVLLPGRFMPVLESDDRCVPLFKLALLQTIKAADKFTDREIDFDWISVVMPIRLLHRRDCTDILTEFTGKVNADPQRICLEISPLLAEEYDGCCRESLQKLRKAGFHTMLTGVGGSSFPLLKLSEFEPEYAAMDEEITRMLGTGDRAENTARSAISFIGSLDAQPVAVGISSAEAADKLYDYECLFYTGGGSSGEFSGEFRSEKYIRRKNRDG